MKGFSSNPTDYAAPLVLIMIGHQPQRHRMNLFISGAYYSQDHYMNNGVPMDNIFFFNDQDFKHVDKTNFGDKLKRTGDKYYGQTWPDKRTFYCNDR